MEDDVVRCPGCPRWLGVLRDGYVESQRKGRSWRIVTGDVICEQCGASVGVVDGRPVPVLFRLNGRPITVADLKPALGQRLGGAFRVA